MAKSNHNTLVNGTAYKITSGKNLVDGTAYDIVKGKTLIDGTSYDIEFSKIVTVTYVPDASLNYAYISIAGTVIKTNRNETYEVEVPSYKYTVIAHVEAQWGDGQNTIILNGDVVKTGHNIFYEFETSADQIDVTMTRVNHGADYLNDWIMDITTKN